MAAEKIHIDINKPILLIDASYYVFYRFYAVYNWWSHQDENKEKPKDKLMDDPSFNEKYVKMFKSVLMNLSKLHEVPVTNIIFAKDCPRDTIWRHQNYDAYKSTREETRLASFDASVFTFTFASVLPTVGCKVLAVDALEADDIIAILTKMILQKNPDADITIITNDNDYIQLCTLSDNISIMNLQGKQLKDRAEVAVDKYILYKTIIGDKSDNIPSIMKKVGIKTAQKLALNPDELQKVFDKHPEAKRQYEMNDLIMNFNNIPAHLCDRVVEKVQT